MRGVISYVLAGIFVVLAMDIVAPPAGLGLSVSAWPALEERSVLQSVDRTHKSDRLPIPAASGRRPATPQAPATLIGCEPVFSSLSSAASANFPGRCVVERLRPHLAVG
jgi:hypothetical protein